MDDSSSPFIPVEDTGSLGWGSVSSASFAQPGAHVSCPEPPETRCLQVLSIDAGGKASYSRSEQLGHSRQLFSEFPLWLSGLRAQLVSIRM